MKRPECKVKSCTDEKPTGSCLRYHEGFTHGLERAAEYIEACNDYGFRELAKSIRALDTTDAKGAK